MGRSQLVSVVAGLVALLVVPPLARAQSTDLMYGGWTSDVNGGSARSLGLAGAVVGLADDSSAVYTNPAGLVRLPKTELAGTIVLAQDGNGASRSTATAWSGPGFIAGAGRLGARVGVGGYLVQSFGGDIAFSARPLGDGTVVTTNLSRRVVEGGAAIAYEIRPGFSAGLRLTGTHLVLEGLSSSPALIVGTSAGSTRVTGSLGVLYAKERGGVGLALQPGSSFTPDRVANDGRGAPIDPGSEYEVRIPSKLSVGGSLRMSPRLLLTGQADFVRYGEVASALVDRPGAAPALDFSLEDAVEPRAAAEFAFPFSTTSFVIRAGVRSVAPSALRYSGSRSAEATVFQGTSRRTLATGGVTLETVAGFVVDLGAEFGGLADMWSGGVRFRF